MAIEQNTPWHKSAGIGLVVGSTEAYVNHPLWALKTRMQAGYHFTLNPRVLYRGVVSHATSSVPLDALQISVSRFVMERFFSAETPIEKKRIVGGLVGGCSAALISCPAELIMTYQQNNMDFRSAVAKITQLGRLQNLYRGFLPTIGRESLFCCGFFSGVPLIKQKLVDLGHSELVSTFVSGILCGIGTAIISHPFDTIKTVVQASEEKKSGRAIAVEIFHKQGWSGYFTGLTMRLARVTSAVLILGGFNDYLERKFLYGPGSPPL